VDPQRIVANGYDALGGAYADWAGRAVDDRGPWLDAFDVLVPAESPVLELGCGPGGPTTRRLAARFDLTGVDTSGAQLEAARGAVPNARFVHADMLDLDLLPASVAGIVAFFSLIHLPAASLPILLGRAASWLRPGGVLLAILPLAGNDAVEEEWLGVPMFFGGGSLESNRRALADAGFTAIRDEALEVHEPGGTFSFQWVLERVPDGADRESGG
jgi:SAM-dependent methyltransferase